MTGSKEIAAGVLRLHVADRTFGNDGGPDIRVYGPTASGKREMQLLRFDCFKMQPHYHYDPEGRDEHHNMEGAAVADPVSWAIVQLRQNLSDMVRRAGGSEEAIAAADTPEIHDAISEIARSLGHE